MAICILDFPSGCGCRTWIIALVKIEEDGVACYDSNGVLLAKVETSDPLAQQRVAEAIKNCLNAGKGFKQPDWEKLVRGVTA